MFFIFFQFKSLLTLLSCPSVCLSVRTVIVDIRSFSIYLVNAVFCALQNYLVDKFVINLTS